MLILRTGDEREIGQLLVPYKVLIQLPGKRAGARPESLSSGE
jgi:hypothetical protein